MGRRISDKTKSSRGYGVIDLDKPWEYKPWIHTRELTSGNGRRHIINDIRYSQRQIHLMSDLERDVYYKLRTDNNIIEIFEQYPLKLETTIEICNKYGLKHPIIPGAFKYNIMTTDFLALVKDLSGVKFKAFAVKMEKDLNDPRVCEKLKIEQLYWESLNIEWYIITEKDL